MSYSTDDQNRLRGSNHRVKAILNITPKVVIATAQINQAAFTYPLAELTIDNYTADSTPKVGHMVMVGTTPGASDVTVGVLRKPISGSTLYIDAKSQGDSGVSLNIRTPLANNQYITILKFRPAWGLLSSIRDGKFYKAWDVPYTGQGTNPDPVVVMGEWLQYFAPDGGTVEIPLSSADSYGWGGRAIVSRVWNLDGGTTDDELTDESLTGEFGPGFYELECTVTDELGKTRTGYRYLWVNVDDPAHEHAPFSYRYPVGITEDTQVVLGRNITYTFGGNLTDIDDLYPGQGVLMSERPTFNGQVLTSSSFVKSYVGYRVDIAKETSYRRRNTGFATRSPVLMGSEIPAATQEMNEVPNAADWSQVGRALSNPAGAVWYIAAHHAPYLIDGHDYVPDSSVFNMRRKTFQFKSTDIAGQLKTVSDMALAGVGNRSNGRLRIVRNPNYLTLAERNALDIKFTYLPGDIAGELSYSQSYRTAVRKVNGYAFSFDGATPVAYQSLAPGYVESQATSISSMTPFIAPAIGGQDYTNAVTGHQVAYEDAKPFEFTADRNLDIAEPIDMDQWFQRAIPGRFDSEGLALSGRMMNTRVSRSWDFSTATTKTIQQEFKPESFGVPGVTIPINQGGANKWWLNNWNPGVFDFFAPIMPDLGIDLPVMLAANAEGMLARTFTFGEPQVAWQRLNGRTGAFVGKVLSFTMDFNSPYFADPSGALKFHILTLDGAVLRAYVLNNAFATNVTYTEYTGSGLAVGTGFNGKAKLLSSRQTPDLHLIVWRNQTGVMFSRSTASTPSLSSPAHIGSTITDPDHPSEDIGADIYGDSQFVIAPDGSTDLEGKDGYKLFYATGSGSFSAVGSEPDADITALLGSVRANSESWAYVPYVKADPPSPPAALGIVTFDGGGQTGYEVLGAGVIPTVGHPDSCAYAATNVNGAGGGVAVVVRCEFLEEQYIVTDVEFDVKFDYIGSIDNQIDLLPVRAFVGDRLVGYGLATARENYGDGWIKYGIRADELRLTESPDVITVTAGYSVDDSSPTTIIYSYIDNIAITGTPIQAEGFRALYRVSSDGAVWSDVTPNGGQLPLRTYSIGGGADEDTTLLSMLGTSETGKTYLINTTSGGTGWTVAGRNSFTGLKRSGNNLLAWGYSTIAISPDIGQTFYPRVGDWIASVGALGEFTNVAGVM